MEKIRFGKTDLTVSRTGFGGIPIQRISDEEAVAFLHRAYDGGITLYDTARVYSDSEHKMGLAFGDMRKDVIICTKTMSTTRDAMFKDLETSLNNLRTDYIDVYQLHAPKFVPKQGDEMYETLLEMKAQGMVKHIGITNHVLAFAKEAVESDLYETLQFPLSPLSTPDEFALSDMCKEHDMGLLGMKALCGGIITKAITSFVTLRPYENLVPIWGMQANHELDEILGYENNPPEMTDEIQAIINADKEELSGTFCRGCGYCQPCPAGIPIEFAAKISFSIFRLGAEQYFTDQWRENMNKIEDCIHCNNCINHCPYGIDTPALLEEQLRKYNILYDRHAKGLPLEKLK